MSRFQYAGQEYMRRVLELLEKRPDLSLAACADSVEPDEPHRVIAGAVKEWAEALDPKKLNYIGKCYFSTGLYGQAGALVDAYLGTANPGLAVGIRCLVEGEPLRAENELAIWRSLVPGDLVALSSRVSLRQAKQNVQTIMRVDSCGGDDAAVKLSCRIVCAVRPPTVVDRYGRRDDHRVYGKVEMLKTVEALDRYQEEVQAKHAVDSATVFDFVVRLQRLGCGSYGVAQTITEQPVGHYAKHIVCVKSIDGVEIEPEWKMDTAAVEASKVTMGLTPLPTLWERARLVQAVGSADDMLSLGPDATHLVCAYLGATCPIRSCKTAAVPPSELLSACRRAADKMAEAPATRVETVPCGSDDLPGMAAWSTDHWNIWTCNTVPAGVLASDYRAFGCDQPPTFPGGTFPLRRLKPSAQLCRTCSAANRIFNERDAEALVRCQS